VSEVKAIFYRFLRTATSAGLAMLARVVTGVRPLWLGTTPSDRQRIYFANHASHGDFILLSACLPARERARTRAVAAADYWGTSRLKRFLAEEMLCSVLIERNSAERKQDPMAVMLGVLDQGDSLIVFPEGTRNTTGAPIQPFKSGLYNLAEARPEVELIPCFIENMSRVLPKGEFLPVPLLCRVIFGAPVAPREGEDRHAFLDRAREAVAALDPRPEKR
jgi:1-acyl-sn-glycerol-3-phosphate acyltransferase